MWTEELLTLMFMSRRRNSQRAANPKPAAGQMFTVPMELVTEEQLFNQVGFKPEVIQFNAN